jgi:DNA-binding IclR family transcriptional regulator
VNKTSARTVRSVARALAILGAFGPEQPELGVTELATRTGLPKSVVHLLASTLYQAGFLDRNPFNGKFRVGLKAFEVGSLYLRGNQLEREALPVLQALVTAFGCNGYLGTLDRGEVVYLAIVENPRPLRIHIQAGSRTYAHTTALGKALLAHLPSDRLEEWLATHPLLALTPRTITDPARLRAELAQVRARGYSVALEENIPGVGAVGAPLRDRGGEAVAAVSLAFLCHLVDESRIEQLGRAVREAAETISARLGAGGVGR